MSAFNPIRCRWFGHKWFAINADLQLCARSHCQVMRETRRSA